MSEEKQELSIKETLEVLDGLEVLAVAGVAISADGKIGVDDLKYLVDVAKKFNVIQEAVKDADLALKEIGDLDEGEAAQIIAKVFSIVKSVKDAKASK